MSTFKGKPIDVHDDLATAVRDYPTENLLAAVELYETVAIPLARRTSAEESVKRELDIIQAEIERRATS